MSFQNLTKAYPKTIVLSIIIMIVMSFQNMAEKHPNYFKIIVLGSGGGPLDNDLSGYLLAPIHSKDFIALDAGTLLSGIRLAVEKGSFSDVQPAENLSLTGEIFLNCIKAYLISHAHLDHVAGLVIGSQSDREKEIIAMPMTIEYIKEHLFNWKIWPNFANEGVEPHLNVYQYRRLDVWEKTMIPHTQMSVRAHPLSHPDGYLSTAFLIESQENYILYFGDTSPDHLEKMKNIFQIFQKIAPLIREKKLKGMFLECSYANRRENEELFGHLDPKFLLSELHELASLVDPKNPQKALAGFKVFITHIKDTLKAGRTSLEIIEEELNKLNDLGIEFLFPLPGERYEI